MVSVSTVLTVGLSILTVTALLASVLAVGRLQGAIRRWRSIARSRLVMGIPWGSLLVIGFVFCVYLFVQDGITEFDNPVTIPYRSYSYFYPQGMLAASFSHVSPNHLLGNLSGALVAAPIVEYAWGHYPDRQDRDASSLPSWYTDPWTRAVVVFPLAVVVVAIATSFFALGPVIGFSGVVFAFAAFALVHYPIVTIIGLLGVQGVLLTLYRAFRVPIDVYVAEPRPPAPPSWAGIAIQGHALGFLVGLVLGIAVLRRREHAPNPVHVWLGILLFAFAQGLWRIYWFGSENSYILFQGPGVFVVTVLSLVCTLAVVEVERRLLPRRLVRPFDPVRSDDDSPVDRPLELARSAAPSPSPLAKANVERISELAGGTRRRWNWVSDLKRRRIAYWTVLLVFAIVAGIAVPANLFVLEEANATSDAAIQIEDYTIQYEEDVENELTSPVQIGPLEEAVSIEASGVIVASEERQIWSEVVPARQLAFTGEESISVGEPGWRETVHVERTGWEPVGNDTVYQVEIWADGDERRVAHESDRSQADVRIDNSTVTVASIDEEFVLEVESTTPGADRRETTPIPDEGASATAGGLTFERDDETIYAVTNDTRVAIASEETYN